jgi:hypothetical protein
MKRLSIQVKLNPMDNEQLSGKLSARDGAEGSPRLD